MDIRVKIAILGVSVIGACTVAVALWKHNRKPEVKERKLMKDVNKKFKKFQFGNLKKKEA